MTDIASSVDPRLTLAVFLPRGTEGDLRALLERGGLEVHTATDETVAARAAGLGLEFWLDERPDHRVLLARFGRTEFLSLRPDPAEPRREHDPAMGFAEAFSAACRRLNAEVGVVLTHAHQDPDWLAEHDWAVLAREANHLVDLRAALLYLDDELAAELTDRDIRVQGREQLRAPRGLTLFASEGWDRWF